MRPAASVQQQQQQNTKPQEAGNHDVRRPVAVAVLVR